MFAQQPDQILDQLIVHARRTKFGQIENDAQIVDDLFEGSIACLFQTIYDKFGQLVDVTCGSVMVFGWNVYNWTTRTVSVLENASLVGIA